MFDAMAAFLRQKEALIVTKIYREPKGATPVTIWGIPISFGWGSQRIEVANSKYHRFAIQLIGDLIRSKLKDYRRDPEWRVLRVQEGDKPVEEVLVSVTSVAKRLGVSKEAVRLSSNEGKLEQFIAGQSFVS